MLVERCSVEFVDLLIFFLSSTIGHKKKSSVDLKK